MSTVYKVIKHDIESFMRTKNPFLVSLRYLDSNIQKASMDSRKEIDDELVYNAIKSEIKKLEEQIRIYEKANRQDLVQKVKTEKDIFTVYIPAQRSDEEITKIVESIISTLNPSGIKEMGKVMAEIKKNYGSSVDMNKVSAMVKSKLMVI